MTQRFRSYVALGDSFTEGMNDHYDDGTLRGWADLSAGRLARACPGLSYANLAVRGRLFDQVVDDQVSEALRMRADLVSFVAGGNDLLRPGFNPTKMATRLHEAVRVLKASEAQVILFTFAAGGNRFPGGPLLRSRLSSANAAITRVAKRHDTMLIDLWSDNAFTDERMWSVDRLHMSELGHKRVASLVCDALGISADVSWKQDLPDPEPIRWLNRRRQDMSWAKLHLSPWVKRRLTGKSSGDDVLPKRPQLLELPSED